MTLALLLEVRPLTALTDRHRVPLYGRGDPDRHTSHARLELTEDTYRHTTVSPCFHGAPLLLSHATPQHPAQEAHARSPRMRRASWMSFGMMVTRLAWMAHRLVSSKRPTK
jgi:hypothetical protein